MAKGLQGLAQRVDFKRIKVNMTQICDQTYLNNLVRRAFLALKTRKFSKESKNQMLVRARQFLAARSLQLLFYAWKDANMHMRQRNLLSMEVERFYNKKIYRMVF